MHEAKVDIVTVPNLSEHLSSAETTQQLSARFAYAAAMKSINNLLLLGDGETWSRQSVDFGGLPEMVRTFLQVAAGAADIPVTRLLGQSPAGLSATGDSDTRNYYDMIAARQELDLRPQLERLDRLIARSEGIDPAALSFAFRPLWQLDAPAQAALALQKAQATQIYASLKLWPDAVTARLVEAQLVADGTYPNAAAVFGEDGAVEVVDANTSDTAFAGAGAFHYLTEPRRENGEWTEGGANASPLQLAMAAPPVVGSVAGSVGPAGASAGGAHAPDGTPITLVAGKKPLRARWLGSIVGGIGSFVRRYWPEDDEPEILPEPDLPKSAPQQAQPPNQTLNDLTRVTRGFAGRKSAQKWLNQMNDRGWTPEQIEEAIESGRPIKETQRIDPTHGATRYIHPRTGRSVKIDDVTGQVIQLGGDGFDY